MSLALLNISSTIKDLQFVLFSHHSRTDRPRTCTITQANISTCTGHTDFVWAVDWSPDRKRVVSASQDKRVQVWDTTTGNPMFIYHGHTANVWTVAWSHDSRCISSGGKDTTVQIWDSLTGDHVFLYTHRTGTIWAAYWSPAAQIIASASSDKTVQVWQAS